VAGSPLYSGSKKFSWAGDILQAIHKGIQHYHSIMALITDYLKREEFQWFVAVTKAFKKIKQHMTKVPVMRLSDFS